jgi:hypothetical protein
MSVARCLGLDEADGPAMTAAALAWQRWCHQDPELAVVDDLLDLPRWTRRATTATKDALLARLHRLAKDDAEAATVLAWLLLPGAARLADSLRDLSPDIDAMTAGELWLQIRSRPAQRCVAATVLRSVRRALLAELGHAAAARGSDRIWASTRLCDDPADLDSQAAQPGFHTDAESESGFLVQEAVLAGAISYEEAALLHQLADAADRQWAPARRGRGGLTSPAVVEFAMRHRKLSPRTIRRAATAIIERLEAFARKHHVSDDLHHFVITHDLPPVALVDFLELYFWDHIEEYLAESRETA